MRRLHSKHSIDNTLPDQTKIDTPTLKNERRVAPGLTRTSLQSLFKTESLVNITKDISQSQPYIAKTQVFSEEFSLELGSHSEQGTSQFHVVKLPDDSKSRDHSCCCNTDTRSDILTMFSDIHATFGLKFRTLTLACNILQKFLYSRPAQLSFPHGHAVTFAIMSIACKVNQVYCPRVSEMFQNYRQRGVPIRCSLADVIQLQKLVVKITNADLEIHSHYDLVLRNQFPQRLRYAVELMAQLGFIDVRIYRYGDKTISAAIINTIRSLSSEEEFASGVEVKRCQQQFAITLQECEQKHPVLWKKYNNQRGRMEIFECE